MMARVDLETKKKVGKMYRIYTETFEIPDKIICKKDGMIMNWDSSKQEYCCSSCDETLRGVDFVKQEIFDNLINQEEDEM